MKLLEFGTGFVADVLFRCEQQLSNSLKVVETSRVSEKKMTLEKRANACPCDVTKSLALY